jgi:hypothetical protein
VKLLLSRRRGVDVQTAGLVTAETAQFCAWNCFVASPNCDY